MTTFSVTNIVLVTGFCRDRGYFNFVGKTWDLGVSNFHQNKQLLRAKIPKWQKDSQHTYFQN